MPKDKPAIYLDTNILSVMFYVGDSIDVAHQQMVTREWWATERRWFRVHASAFTERELSQGHYHGQRKSLALVRRLPYLPLTSEVRRGAQSYLEQRLIPETVAGDAFQLAFASAHRMDYLLTWNYAHLANPETQRRLTIINRVLGWQTPNVVSPESIPHASLGQDIWRQRNEIEEET